ncbi:MAG: photosystem I reaction center subunit XII [Actinomycetales bacterium]|nr:MAG: photosystem I reaction center subunit XII [Actinomycetales bacterium]
MSALGTGVGEIEIVVALTVALVASVLATRVILRSSQGG